MILISLSLSMSSCGKENSQEITSENGNNIGDPNNTTGSKMKITIGTAVFTATLNTNTAGNAFKAKLPLTLNMTELNDNEK